MQDLKEMWERVLSKIEPVVSIVAYELWIEPIIPLDYTDKLILVANSATAKKQLQKNHAKELSDSICEIFGSETEYEILDPDEKEAYLKQKEPETVVEQQTKPEEEKGTPEIKEAHQKLKLENHNGENKKILEKSVRFNRTPGDLIERFKC